MSTFTVGVLAAIVATGIAAPFGWWLRGRRIVTREAELEARIAGLHHVVAAHRSATEQVSRHAVTTMADLVAMSATLLRMKRERP